VNYRHIGVSIYMIILNSLIVNAGLTSGLFTKNSVEIPCPDNAAGLYIRTRDNQVVKVVFLQAVEL